MKSKVKKTKKELFQQKLETYLKDYEKTKKLICEVGFIAEGSIVKCYIRCGKKNCRCHKEKQYRHGPYYQLTWKEKGKTVTRYLSNEIAQLYHEWIANRQKLSIMIKKMNTISLNARECISAINMINDPHLKAKKTSFKSH